MKQQRKAAVLASFAADSLALGVHWIYDTKKISETYGRVEHLAAPGADSFHSGRTAGDFTHYGDQTLVLLRSVAEKGAFVLEDFSQKWRALFADYDGYVDGATRKTLAGYEAGKGPAEAGSPSNDLAGAARIAPLVFRYGGETEQLVDAARKQTLMTHQDANVVDAAGFFARAADRVLQGSAPTAAIEAVAAEETFQMSPLSMWTEQGLASKDEDSVSAIKRFGQACEIPQAFSGVIHLIARYETDLREALIQSAMAGGDSSARGMLTGMILGAHLGMDALPGEWVSGMNRKDDIFQALEAI